MADSRGFTLIHSGIYQHDIPCAVCHVSTRTSVLMIPAKIQCPVPWIREYYGYLTADHDGHYRTSFILASPKDNYNPQKCVACFLHVNSI